MSRTVRFLMIGSALTTCVALGGAAYSVARNLPVPSNQQPLRTPPTRPAALTAVSAPAGTGDALAPPRDSLGAACVGATGTTEPAGEAVAVGAPVPGLVTKVLVRPGDTVAEGAVLFTLDLRTVAAETASAEENLKAAEARLRELEAQLPVVAAQAESAAARVERAQVILAERRRRVARAEPLAVRGAISAEDLDERRSQTDQAVADLAEAEARRAEAQASLALLRGPSPTGPAAGPTLLVQQAAVAQARAALELARTAVELRTVRAPLAGVVLQVKIRAGEYATAAALSEPLITMGAAGPLHVRVEIDESEIGRFVPAEAPAVACLRGAAQERIPLTFVRVEPLIVPKRVLTGSVSERVDTRVQQLLYALPAGTPGAFPGRQVDVFIEETPVAAQP